MHFGCVRLWRVVDACSCLLATCFPVFAVTASACCQFAVAALVCLTRVECLVLKCLEFRALGGASRGCASLLYFVLKGGVVVLGEILRLLLEAGT